MMIDRKEYTKKKYQQRQKAAMKAVLKRSALFSGLSEPSAATVEKYIQGLDALRLELASKYGDLGRGPASAGGKLQTERSMALGLLAKIRLSQIVPGERL